MDKYTKATLPTPDVARTMAGDFDKWAEEALKADRYGSARQFELIALLLRFYADRPNQIALAECEPTEGVVPDELSPRGRPHR